MKAQAIREMNESRELTRGESWVDVSIKDDVDVYRNALNGLDFSFERLN